MSPQSSHKLRSAVIYLLLDSADLLIVLLCTGMEGDLDVLDIFR